MPDPYKSKGYKLQTSQHGCVRWALFEHLSPPCYDFACGKLRIEKLNVRQASIGLNIRSHTHIDDYLQGKTFMTVIVGSNKRIIHRTIIAGRRTNVHANEQTIISGGSNIHATQRTIISGGETNIQLGNTNEPTQ